MTRSAALIGFIIVGGLAALWLNLGQGSADPSLSDHPDIIDVYGGVVIVPAGRIDVPPPERPAADAPDAATLAQEVRRLRLPELVARWGEPADRREGERGLTLVLWIDRASAPDPDRNGRTVGAHLVTVVDAKDTVRQVHAVISGARVVGSW